MEEIDCTGEWLYYPGYWIHNEALLKYALLHISKLYVIPPDIANQHSNSQNDSMSYIWKNSDLIEPYRPDERIGEAASERAIRKLQWYSRSNRIQVDERKVFNGKEYQRGCRRETYRYWDYYIQNHRNCEFMQEPFSKPFEYYCIRNRLAERRGNKVFISQSIISIYYIELAKVIAEIDKKRLITDDIQAAIKLKKLKPFLYSEETDRTIQYYKEKPKGLAELTIEEAVDWRRKYTMK